MRKLKPEAVDAAAKSLAADEGMLSSWETYREKAWEAVHAAFDVQFADAETFVDEGTMKDVYWMVKIGELEDGQ